MSVISSKMVSGDPSIRAINRGCEMDIWPPLIEGTVRNSSSKTLTVFEHSIAMTRDLRLFPARNNFHAHRAIARADCGCVAAVAYGIQNDSETCQTTANFLAHHRVVFA